MHIHESVTMSRHADISQLWPLTLSRLSTETCRQSVDASHVLTGRRLGCGAATIAPLVSGGLLEFVDVRLLMDRNPADESVP